MKTQINYSNSTNKTALAGQASSSVPVFKNQTKPDAERALAGALREFVGQNQAAVIRQQMEGEEGQFFIERVGTLLEIVTVMPTTYETHGQGDKAIVFLHYFTAGADWHITERDQEAEQLQAFGLADLGYGGELGYISIVELLECGAELDLHWTLKNLSEI